MAGCLCDKCSALCCRYFALPIDNPDCKKDFDNIRWYLVHENVVVFVEKKQWYIGIMNRCKNLQDDNRCGIYHTRPQICRSYSTDNCDYHGGDYNYDRLFTSADGLWTYAMEFLRDQRIANRKKKVRKAARKKPARRAARPTLRLNAELRGRSSAGTPGPLAVKADASGRTIRLPLLGV